MASTEIERRKRRGAMLREERGTLNNHLEEIASVIYPNAQGFIGETTRGAKRMTQVYDETGIASNELLAASLGGIVTNPASKWFSIRVLGDKAVNESPNVKKWRSDVEDILYEEMYAPGSNLSPTLDEFYLSLGAFGTSIFFVGETQRGTLQFQARSLAECFISENADGQIDTVYRYFKWSVRQIMQVAEWTPSDKVRDLYAKGKLDDRIELCHCVEPRETYDRTKKGKRNMPFVSSYYEVETCHELEAGGFPEFPYIVARWRRVAGEVYGRSPGMTALPAVKMLQAIESSVIIQMQKIVNPTRYLRHDGVLGQIRTIPGAINYWAGDPNTGVMLEPTTDKMPVAFEWVEGIRNRVRTTFHNDTLQIVDDREMTLGEARMRRTERMRLQGPVNGRLDAEMLGPMIERIYGVLDRKGKIPLAPAEMEGRGISVEFVSPLSNAQKQEQLAGLVQAFDYVAPLGDLGIQALAKRVNMDRLIDGIWEVLSNDPDWLNTPEEMQAVQQQAQMASNAQLAEPMANAAASGAGAIKDLADAQASGGFDMSKIMAMLRQMPQGQGMQRAA